MKVQNIKNLRGVEAQTTPKELQLLIDYALKSGTRPEIVEIGSYCGASSIVLAEVAGHLTCVDPFIGKHGKDKRGIFTFHVFEKNVLNKYRNVTLFQMTSKFARESFAGGEIDFLFIDGDHSYEAVKLDCELWLPLLKSGGYVAFHDYWNVHKPGVKQAVDEMINDWEIIDTARITVIKQKPYER